VYKRKFHEENGGLGSKGERREGRKNISLHHSPHTFSIIHVHVEFKLFFESQLQLVRVFLKNKLLAVLGT
jgi:hypothetical protein